MFQLGGFGLAEARDALIGRVRARPHLKACHWLVRDWLISKLMARGASAVLIFLFRALRGLRLK